MTKLEIIVKESGAGVVEVLAMIAPRGADETDAERAIASDIYKLIENWMRSDSNSADCTLKETMSVAKPSPEFIADVKKRLER